MFCEAAWSLMQMHKDLFKVTIWGSKLLTKLGLYITCSKQADNRLSLRGLGYINLGYIS